MPPYLAGRRAETDEFRRLLEQETILRNLILTGLRGVGKTVLLETFKPLAQEAAWSWVGTDLSESASITEKNLAIRLLTDLAVVTSDIVVDTRIEQTMGFRPAETVREQTLDYETLVSFFERTPGLVSDKLKAVLEIVWEAFRLTRPSTHGLVFAYDEAQNLADHAEKEQYPLSLLLDVFQSIQRKEIPFMLVLVGLPTLFPKLVEARTYSERMFHVVFLDRLNESDAKDAILKPLDQSEHLIFSGDSIGNIVSASGGYPYFIQFICREAYDAMQQKLIAGNAPSVPMREIVRKLDEDFFAGRWARATDRQRDLLYVISSLTYCDGEFSVQEIVQQSKELSVKAFSSSHVSQMLTSLSNAGLIYKNRHGKYSFAVPLLGQFIQRQEMSGTNESG
ncbi:MAG: AAA family ATPase [Planctomycetes bacterium]|jgi:hypothetical protein|nr:AAA family ATPase [Phycisphaerae bacterium]NBB94810.1 AAA family ATPase [Planctomycetota bacterium]